MVASVGIAAAAAVLCAIAWPRMVQARHARPMEKLPHYNLDDARSSPSVPYRSQVAGVDELYLRGVYFYEERTPDSLQRSLQDFSDAIAKDPNYAPAYAGLSNAYNLMREYSRMSNEEAFPKAKAAAEHAIALDPTLPQAHASLGFIDFFWSWDAAAAESEFQTALALDPNSVLAHHWYGSMLTHQGRYDEALEQLNIAQRLQPTSVAIMSVRALALGLSGHRDDATEMLQEVLRDAPGATSPHTILSTLSLVEPRDLPRYLDETTRVAELRHDEDLAQVIAAARTAYRARGETAMWTTILNEDAKRHPRKEDRTFQMAQAHAALGRYDDALDDLSAMATRHDVSLVGLDVDPTLRPMYSDPRFTRLAATLGIPAKTPAR
jgi:serine/threonine-protein kinase